MRAHQEQPNRPPPNPYLVLALAALMPGAGHVVLGEQQRGFGFAAFSLLLAMICWQTTGPETSVIGRTAFGLFVWALSIPDAYRIARVRHELWRRSQSSA